MTISMGPLPVPETPTLDKMIRLRDQSQAIGEFLEWLSDGGLRLARWESPVEEVPVFRYELTEKGTCPPGALRSEWLEEIVRYRQVKGGPRLFQTTESIESLLCRYFGIDQKEIEREKRALLEHARSIADGDAPKKGGAQAK